ncbi:hypothetical protein [Kingella denitrificans]|uniref:hypothetical protein n=1 Tax=Kingella denitrificans TaxID=502 RepID=UPI0028D22571|nr:hypothetical protein [Kingella denitrificans]
MSSLSSKQRIRRAAWVIGIVSCAAMGYAGWKFILAAEQSAENIQSNVVSSEPVVFQETASAEVLPASNAVAAISVSTGQDIKIQEGELRYQDGVPVLRLRIQNLGQFKIARVYVRLQMLPQSESAVLAQSVLKMSLAEPLNVGKTTLLTFPINDEKWLIATEQDASPKRALVQVLSVGNAEIEGADYPQQSAAIQIAEIPTDRTRDTDDDEDDGDKDRIDERRQPPQESEPEEDVVDEILRKENESATGDPRVMSYEARQSRQPAPDKSER